MLGSRNWPALRRLRAPLAVVVALALAVGLAYQVFAAPTITNYTGCLSPVGNLYNLRTGASSTGPCRKGDTQVTLSGVANLQAASANTPNTLVERDGNGNFSAATITASLNGNATSASRADSVPWSGLTGKPDLMTRLVRTVVVGPVADGSDQTANGTALLNALASIANASQANPYLLKIEPGIYDVGSTPVVMKEWVDIAGSGELVTTITGAGSNEMSSVASSGTVIGADNSELRFITVEARSNYDSTAIYESPRLSNVTVSAGGMFSCGVCRSASSSLSMSNVTISVAGMYNNAFGVSAPVVTMNNVTVAVGGNRTFGVDASQVTMNNVTVTVTGGYGGGDLPYGSALLTGSSSIIMNSRLRGTISIYGSGGTPYVAASQLVGVLHASPKCAGVYDSGFNFYADTCPTQ